MPGRKRDVSTVTFEAFTVESSCYFFSRCSLWIEPSELIVRTPAFRQNVFRSKPSTAQLAYRNLHAKRILLKGWLARPPGLCTFPRQRRKRPGSIHVFRSKTSSSVPSSSVSLAPGSLVYDHYWIRLWRRTFRSRNLPVLLGTGNFVTVLSWSRDRSWAPARRLVPRTSSYYQWWNFQIVLK